MKFMKLKKKNFFKKIFDSISFIVWIQLNQNGRYFGNILEN